MSVMEQRVAVVSHHSMSLWAEIFLFYIIYLVTQHFTKQIYFNRSGGHNQVYATSYVLMLK